MPDYFPLKISGFVLCTCLGLGVACTGSFEEINTNPNSPSSVPPELLLAGIEREVMTALINEAWETGSTVVQHTAKTQTNNVDRYQWGERLNLWNAVYDNLRNVQNILHQSEQAQMSHYRPIALVLRAWMFSLITDCYGDIPYSEALSGKSGVLFPKYDRQEAIYQGILQELTEANQLLKGPQGSVGNDVIYEGQLSQWRKLANSLRLRYLLRLSGRQEVGAAMQAIVANPSENPIMKSNEDNATYSYTSTSPDQFPIATYRLGTFNEWRAGKTLLDVLQNLEDPRLRIFFRSTPRTETTPNSSDDQYSGLPNGLSEANTWVYNGGPDFQSRVGKLYYEEATSERGRQIAQGILMTFAELQFILAEAAQKGLITGNPQTYYTQGIQASFQFYGLSPTASYLAQEGVQLSGNNDQRLEKILTQKWIALYFQGMEAWFDWRRTGYPILQPGADNLNANQIPVRFIYPLVEQTLNGTNRTTAINRQGPDDINTRVWWDVQ